jgi:hypothetical protein
VEGTIVLQQGNGDHAKGPHTVPDDVKAVLTAASQRMADSYDGCRRRWDTGDVVVFVSQDPVSPDDPLRISAVPREYLLAEKDREMAAGGRVAAAFARVAAVYDELTKRPPRGRFWVVFAVGGKFGLMSQLVERRRV